MKKNLYIFIVIFISLVIFAFFFNSLYLKYILSAYIGRKLNVDIKIDQARWESAGSINAKGIFIRNKKGLSCSIEEAIIHYDAISIIKMAPTFSFKSRGVKLSNPDSAVINGIAEIMSIKPLDLFSFDRAEGRLYLKKRELIIRGFNATARFIRLYIDGTVVANSRIDAAFKIMLAGELLANIPETTRKIFFKEQDQWSEVELYITGDMKRPSINFSTDLFKLIISA